MSKNRENQGRIHRIITIKQKGTKSLTLSFYPLWNFLDEKQVVLSAWVICCNCREPFGYVPAKTSPHFLPKFRVEMRGKFLRTCKPFNSPKNWHLNITGIFFHNWDPSYGLLWHFDILREIFMRKYPRWFSREKKGKYLHRNFSLISPEFLQGNYEEITTGMIPWNLPVILCGNLGDVECGWLARCVYIYIYIYIYI